MFICWIFNPVANIIHNEEVDVLSDHYLIECSWIPCNLIEVNVNRENRRTEEMGN